MLYVLPENEVYSAMPQHEFTTLFPQLDRVAMAVTSQKLSQTDLSLVSWLESLGNEQFTVPFQQRTLDFKMEAVKKPKLEAKWAEQILSTPIKPDGKFPHSLVPKDGLLKCAKRMLSQSMILPRGFEDVGDTGSISARESQPLQSYGSRHLQPMSRSTAPAFSIASQETDESLMKQSMRIDNMLGAASTVVSPTVETNGDSVLKPVSSEASSLSSMATGDFRSEVTDSIGGRSHQPPSSLLLTSTIAYRHRPVHQLPPLPELGTPGSEVPPAMPGPNVVVPMAAYSQATLQQGMQNPTLFQQFTNRHSLRSGNDGILWGGAQNAPQLGGMNLNYALPNQVGYGGFNSAYNPHPMQTMPAHVRGVVDNREVMLRPHSMAGFPSSTSQPFMTARQNTAEWGSIRTDMRPRSYVETGNPAPLSPRRYAYILTREAYAMMDL